MRPLPSSPSPKLIELSQGKSERARRVSSVFWYIVIGFAVIMLIKLGAETSLTFHHALMAAVICVAGWDIENFFHGRPTYLRLLGDKLSPDKENTDWRYLSFWTDLAFIVLGGGKLLVTAYPSLLA